MEGLGKKEDASHILMEDLVYIKDLGHGSFGTVFLV